MNARFFDNRIVRGGLNFTAENILSKIRIVSRVDIRIVFFNRSHQILARTSDLFSQGFQTLCLIQNSLFHHRVDLFLRCFVLQRWDHILIGNVVENAVGLT